MRLLGILLGVALLFGSVGGGWAWMEYRRFIKEPLKIEQGTTVYQVEPGATLASIARDLERNGLIGNAQYLQWYGQYTGQANRIRAGEYRLSDSLTPDALLALLVSGKTIEHSLTLLEGWNIRQVRAAVAAHEALKHTVGDIDDAALMDQLAEMAQLSASDLEPMSATMALIARLSRNRSKKAGSGFQ